jgi:cell division protein FtsL
MSDHEELISIPSNDSGLIPVPTSDTELTPSAQKQNEKRFTSIETLVYAVIFVAIISLVGIVVAVTTLVIDQMHFNNQTYRDQSDKTNLQIQQLNLQIETLRERAQSQTAPASN